MLSLNTYEISREKSLDITTLKKSSRISEKDARNLCVKVLGEKDKEMNFKQSYQYEDTLMQNEKEYYIFYVAWLVDDNHWSSVGYVMVSAEGNEIFSGIKDDKGDYYLSEKIWTK